MNDDDHNGELANLKAEHRRLDEQVRSLDCAGDADQLELARLKKRKLKLKDQIQSLQARIIPDIIA